LSGQIGTAGRELFAYQGRPAVVFERDYPEIVNGTMKLWSSFDIVDPGHASSCDNCPAETPLQTAVEQSVLDGLLEDWIAGNKQATSSHQLVQKLLNYGAPLNKQRPATALWSDNHTSGSMAYRLGTVTGSLTGWRLDPGPQVVPILAEGQGGVKADAVKDAASAATSSLIGAIIQNASTKCGASDIVGSMILAMAGAPMTSPLLGGIVSHMCRVAEAYNKAADALNCLEFMDNDCSSRNAAKDLENMLKGLGKALAIDLAVAQALDIAVGAAVEGIISPAVRGMMKKWLNRRCCGRASMPPPGGSVMPPGGSVMPPGGSEMPPGGSVMPPGGSIMPPGGSVMPPGGSVMPPGGSAMPPGKPAPGHSRPSSPDLPPAKPTGTKGATPTTPKVDEPTVKVKEFDPTAPDIDTGVPARPIIKDNYGRTMPYQPHDPKYWSIMREGKIPIGKSEAWVGTFEYGVGMTPRMVDGPYRLDFPGDAKFHKDMSRGATGKAKGFTITRTADGKIKPGPASKESAEMTAQEKEVLRKQLERLIVPID
jgi:hypothetical protein